MTSTKAPSDAQALTLVTTPQDHRIAWLAALAIAIHVAESALPSPLPGAKPGLANVVTLAVLCRYGWRAAAWVTLLRVLVGSLLIGTFLTPTFMLSAAGAAAGLAALALGSRIPGMGPVGLGLMAAQAHMAGQFFCAHALFIPHEGLFALLPVLMTLAAGFGLASGLIVQAMLPALQRPPASLPERQSP